MTIPNKEAVEAAAQALFEESQELDQENSWDDALPDEWRESWRDAAREAIEAALPHLREQIAQEIEAKGRTVADQQRAHDLASGLWDRKGTSSPNEQEWHQYTNWAARIVRGEP